MTIEVLFNLFLIVSATFGITFSIFLFFSNKRKEKSIIYLSLLILSFSLNNLQVWILVKGFFQHNNHIHYLKLPWHFLSMPLFYMFLIHYLKIEEKFTNILKYVLPVFTLACIAQITYIVKIHDGFKHKELFLLYDKYTSIEEIISIISSVMLFIYSFYILFKKENLFQKILLYDDLKWIYNIFWAAILAYVTWIIAVVIKITLNFSGYVFSYYPSRIATTIIIFWLGYQAILQLRITSERKEIRKKTTSNPLEIETNLEELKQQTDSYENEKHYQQFLTIDTLIKQKQKFLHPKYTLQNLSEDTKIGSSTLSSIINSYAKKSFIDYINEMRIEHAKKLLIDPTYKNYTIVSIGLESGFNSKSAFYSVFKKHTSCTPVGYKKSCY